PNSIDAFWIDDAHYNELFQEFLTFHDDPATIVVAALLHSNGTVDLRPWYFIANGTVSPSAPGSYAVRVLDTNGYTLTESTLPVSFTVHVKPLGIRPTNRAPLVVAVPYDKAAATVEILHEGQIITRVSVTTKLLHDAVASIPDAGFREEPAEHRK